MWGKTTYSETYLSTEVFLAEKEDETVGDTSKRRFRTLFNARGGGGRVCGAMGREEQMRPTMARVGSVEI